MKISKFIFIAAMVLFIASCVNDEGGLNVVNSESFNEVQITFDKSVTDRLLLDSLMEEEAKVQEENSRSEKLNELIEEASKFKTNPKDSSWRTFLTKWDDFSENSLTNETQNAKILIQEWTELNINLLKLSEEVRFGDAIEKILYNSPNPVLSDKMLKSVIYTHVFDKIFINILASSSMNYKHTTGGTVTLIQQTNIPEGHEMTLKCELEDTRYMDVYIRIPAWAVNPTVTHGNVKYVPHPGEYCEISRKWKDGDEITVRLINPTP